LHFGFCFSSLFFLLFLFVFLLAESILNLAQRWIICENTDLREKFLELNNSREYDSLDTTY
jgi:hypothetical protein